MANRKGTIPAREGVAVRVGRGRTLRVVNTHGYQVVDFWAFNARKVAEFLSMEHTRPSILKLTPAPGDVLRSNRRRPMLTLVEDTTPGVHDTTIAACNIERYRMLGVEGPHANCEDNLLAALAAIGIEAPEVPCPFNLFQNTRYHPTRGLSFKPPVSRPGQYVAFRAEMDVVAVMSACPMDVLPINRDGPTDAHYEVL
ncbi:MAG: urea carboxylase-associated family protein [Planctomycetes bacterium]|nr:urea carboxylase-associated family protein [Planctomycetota bacterium]